MTENHATFMTHFSDWPSMVRRRIEAAYIFAKDAHRHQERRGGGRYFEHPREVALILIRLGLMEECYPICGLLHDVPEDTKYIDVDFVEQFFGSRIACIIDRLTHRPGDSDDIYFDRMQNRNPFFNECMLVKGADRLHNLRTFDGDGEKAWEKVKETQTYIMRPIQRVRDDNSGAIQEAACSLFRALSDEILRLQSIAANSKI